MLATYYIGQIYPAGVPQTVTPIISSGGIVKLSFTESGDINIILPSSDYLFSFDSIDVNRAIIVHRSGGFDKPRPRPVF
jgi:hypothetical protein